MLKNNGDLEASGILKASGVVYAGNAIMHTDGNLQGSIWGGYLSDHINSRITSNTNGNMAGRAYPRRVGGGALNFNWSGKGGTPTWLWGWRSGDGVEAQDMSVYNPANFSVNYAASAGNANSVGGWTQPTISSQIESRASAWAIQEARNRSPFNAITGQATLTSHGAEWQNNTGHDLIVQGVVTASTSIALRVWNTTTGVTCQTNQFCRVRQGESIRIERSGSGSYSWTGFYFGNVR